MVRVALPPADWSDASTLRKSATLCRRWLNDRGLLRVGQGLFPTFQRARLFSGCPGFWPYEQPQRGKASHCAIRRSLGKGSIDGLVEKAEKSGCRLCRDSRRQPSDHQHNGPSEEQVGRQIVATMGSGGEARHLSQGLPRRFTDTGFVRPLFITSFHRTLRRLYHRLQ